MDFVFIFADSNLDILFKIWLGRCYFILAPTYDFGYAQKVHLSKSSARVTRQNSRLEKCMHAFEINANLPCAIKLTDCIWSQYLFVRSAKSTIFNNITHPNTMPIKYELLDISQTFPEDIIGRLQSNILQICSHV